MENNEIDLVKTVFSNPNGEKLLKIWESVYQDRTSYEPGQTSTEDCLYFEGQRSFLILIKQLLETET